MSSTCVWERAASDEFLRIVIFRTPDELVAKLRHWETEYNHHRPLRIEARKT